MYFRSEFNSRNAGIAQLVEHNLAKVRVASSSLVSRSTVETPSSLFMLYALQSIPQIARHFFLPLPCLL